MYQVTREIDFCFGHRVLGHERCSHLHGHNGRAVITLAAEQLDPLGMVLDFSQIKRVVAGWIDDHLDHRMVLCRDDPAVPLLERLGEPMFLLDEPPTREAIARVIFEVTAQQGFPITDCRLEDSL